MSKLKKLVTTGGRFCLNSTRTDRELLSVSPKDISPLFNREKEIFRKHCIIAMKNFTHLKAMLPELIFNEWSS